MKSLVLTLLMIVSTIYSYDYLIISGEEYIDDFSSFTQFYNNKGITTHLATIENIYQNYDGRDEQEKIRNYIIEHYKQHNISYLLLAGDPTIVPARPLSCKAIMMNWDGSIVNTISDNYIYSDLYYSGLDGDWNSDGDQFWGEYDEELGLDESDLIPEISVGRFPFEDHQQLANMIHKSLNYQEANFSTKYDNVLLVGEKLFNNPEHYGGWELEQLVGEVTHSGFTTQGVPEEYQIDRLYDLDEVWGSTDLIDKLSEGVNLLFSVGHGTPNSFIHLNATNVEYLDMINGVDNPYIFVSTSACQSAYFSEPYHIGKDLLRSEYGAFALRGNSSASWGWILEHNGANLILHRNFVNAIFNKEITTLGDAHRESLIDTAPLVDQEELDPGSRRWTYYGLNIFGDPALELKLSGFNSVDEVTPSTISLEQNYPNPFNPTTIINYNIKSGSRVNLAIFNTAGEQVAELVNGSVNGGSHSIQFDGSNLNSGVYFYKLTANGVSTTKKMVLTK